MSAEQEITDTLAAARTAWNAGDLDGYLAMYWQDDALQWSMKGEWFTGYKTMHDLLKQLYAAHGAMGEADIYDIEVSMLAPDVGVARSLWRERSTVNDGLGGSGLQIFSRMNDRWLVTNEIVARAPVEEAA